MSLTPSDLPSADRREELSIRLILEAIYEQYGYDFRAYSRAHMNRRLRKFLTESPYENFGSLQHHILYDDTLFYDLLQAITVNTTEMFRDPGFYQAFREQVVPILATYPSLKIWHAGCSTGEELYSMAILLQEEGLYDRTLLYATDVSEDALNAAREGIYQADRIQEYTRNYQQAKGTKAFSDYYTSRYQMAVMDKSLSRNAVFASHNLVTDGAFSEMHVVICRNVMIYFNRELQARVLNLFEESLCRKGFLCLGTKETITFTPLANRFDETKHGTKIFRKKD